MVPHMKRKPRPIFTPWNWPNAQDSGGLSKHDLGNHLGQPQHPVAGGSSFKQHSPIHLYQKFIETIRIVDSFATLRMGSSIERAPS